MTESRFRNWIYRWAWFGGAEVPLRARLATAVLFVAGACLCQEFTEDWPTLVERLVFLAALRVGSSGVHSDRRAARAGGWVAAGLFALILLVQVTLTATAGTALAWTVPWWVRILTAVAAIAFMAGPRRLGGVDVPLTVPMGIWLAACWWMGWTWGEGYVSCDDYSQLRSPVEIVVPSRKDLGECRPGLQLPIRRYPRMVWETPEKDRYLFTTQSPIDGDGQPFPTDTITGIVCETPVSGTNSPRCLGGVIGVAGLVSDIPPLNRILVGTWGVPYAMDCDSEILELPAKGPIDVVGHLDFKGGDQGAGYLYEPAHDVLWVMNNAVRTHRFRASDLTPLPAGKIQFMPWGFDYDPVKDEGLVCGIIALDGRQLTNLAAFHGDPPVGRPFVSPGLNLELAVGMALGCGFDIQRRKAFAMFGNVGLLARFDYDTGRLEKTAFVGIGLRTIAYDPHRNRLYITDFFGREVVEFDAETLRETRRWTVGRFPRDLHLTRDGDALLVGTTLGLIRIHLDHDQNWKADVPAMTSM